MTRLICIGMNHTTAPVELRECLAVEPDDTLSALATLKCIPHVKEAFFLSTCNRVEAMAVTDETASAEKSLIDFFSDLGNIQKDRIKASLYVLEDMEAVKHLFMVASSLDSMVIGEPQILGQLKKAYNASVDQKASNVILNRLMHRAFHVAKRVRTETGICEAAVSVSYAAVELARKIFHTLDGKRVLLIGAGEMAELAARQLLSHGVSAMVVANRTFQRAVALAEDFNAQPVSFEEVTLELQKADIVITSTASAEFVITHEQVKGCLRKRHNKPLFFIDIAVPRDVQPEVNHLDNVYVYDVDDLKDVIQFNKAQRLQEAIKAERIVQEEVVNFEKWIKTLAVVPTIVSLKEKAESIVTAELKKSKTALGDLTHAQLDAIRTLTNSIADKMLSDPIVFLKEEADSSDGNNYLDMARKLFKLDIDP